MDLDGAFREDFDLEPEVKSLLQLQLSPAAAKEYNSNPTQTIYQEENKETSHLDDLEELKKLFC